MQTRRVLVIICASMLAVCIILIAALALDSIDFRKGYGYSDERYETFSRDAIFTSPVYYFEGEWTPNNTELLGDELIKITIEQFERTEEGFFVRAHVTSRCTFFKGFYFAVDNYEQIELNLNSGNNKRIPLWYMNTEVDSTGDWRFEGTFVCTQAEIDAAYSPTIEVRGKVFVSLLKPGMLFR